MELKKGYKGSLFLSILCYDLSRCKWHKTLSIFPHLYKYCRIENDFKHEIISSLNLPNKKIS